MRLENECKTDRVDQFYAALHESAFGTKRTSGLYQSMSAFGGKADIPSTRRRAGRDVTDFRVFSGQLV